MIERVNSQECEKEIEGYKTAEELKQEIQNI